MWLFLNLVGVIVISNGFAKSSRLVEIACSRNPGLSFCDDPVPADARPPRPSASKGNESAEIEALLNLPTFEETLLKQAENETAVTETKTRKRKRKNKNTTTTTEATIAEDEEMDSTESDKAATTADPDIPDDPILSEPVPKNQESQDAEGDEDTHLGSLLRLPKPPRKTSSLSEGETSSATTTSEIELVTPPPLPNQEPQRESPIAKSSKPSRVGFVNVYISQFCVDRRKDFLVKCRTANVSPKDLEFCKSYPLDCQSDEDGVVPLLAYCERFIHSYVRVCAPKAKRDRQGRQFCKAYDQFCVPPPTPSDLLESNQALSRCEDIQAEARKVCNPFPPPHDRLNYLRCSQFVKFCSKYVDWQ